ncbi:MAG: chain length determinant protein tyrosine kinase EpsG [Pseudomonadota bacterium]
MKMSVSLLPTTPRANRTIGAILMDAGLLSTDDAERILVVQKQQGLRFGEAAIRLGILKEADIQFALARQFAYPYLRSTADRKPVSDELIAAYQPFSAQVEQLRALRSQLMLRWFDKVEQRQILALVGTEKGEGRSYMAANLAIVLSQLGERTLLIDGNLRTPRQHELFKLDNKLGLSTILAGRSSDESIIRITDLAGLFVLPAGPVPPNPLELLSRPSFDELLANARANFDVIIIDTPSFSTGEDPIIIALRAGAALVMARSATTRVAGFTNLVQGLMNAGVAVVGSVLNEVPAKKASK